jgi:hypothetical protein
MISASICVPLRCTVTALVALLPQPCFSEAGCSQPGRHSWHCHFRSALSPLDPACVPHLQQSVHKTHLALMQTVRPSKGFETHSLFPGLFLLSTVAACTVRSR